MSQITTALTHKQQVLRLYKAAVKEIRNFKPDFQEWRFDATLLRARFEENRDIKDLRVAKIKLLEGQRELEQNRHPFPFQYSYSPGGISYGREPRSQDYVLDQWHPLEKAQFPDYFSKRVEMKKEYITWYVKKYGITSFNPDVEGHISVGEDPHHHDHDHDHHHHHHGHASGEAKEKSKEH